MTPNVVSGGGRNWRLRPRLWTAATNSSNSATTVGHNFSTTAGDLAFMSSRPRAVHVFRHLAQLCH